VNSKCKIKNGKKEWKNPLFKHPSEYEIANRAISVVEIKTILSIRGLFCLLLQSKTINTTDEVSCPAIQQYGETLHRDVF
jgi:hypothetical protein